VTLGQRIRKYYNIDTSHTKTNHNPKKLQSTTTPWRIREQSERSGFFSFFGTFFFFSFQKEKKKSNKEF
jgi:hypothetical protein